MKKYNCPLSDSQCEYGGKKRFNYGFASGIDDYCYHPKQKTFINRPIRGIIDCPLKKESEGKNAE